jgi:transketolase
MKCAENLRGFKAKSLSLEEVAEIKEACRKGRLWTVIMTSVAGSGHPAGSLSSMELYMTLLAAANTSPNMLNDPDRDRIVVSHGHTSPGFYSALAANGFFKPEELVPNFRRTRSPFQGHVERDVPGVDWGTGNLGQGLSAGVGFALAAKARKSPSHTWVFMGDGEQTKGQVAEARRIAFKEGLSNITAIVDWNDIQISGRIEDVMPYDMIKLWEADEWNVFECNGHDVAALYETLREAKDVKGPSVVLCTTVMGRGVSFMEDKPDYHGKAASGDLLEKALSELGGGLEDYERAVADRKKAIPVLKVPAAETLTVETGEPKTYGKDDKIDNRGAFGAALADIGSLNCGKKGAAPILVFDCDLAGSVKTKAFAEACPDFFIQAGIQEHSTATVAGAASIAGVVSVWADFGVFGCDEVYNQQRLNDINRANIKTVLTHSGLDVGEDGMTHQCIGYVGLFRNTFGWKVVVPADPNQTDRATRWMMGESGNICLAMGRGKLPVVLKDDGTPFYAGDYRFRYGAIDLLRQGKDAAILSMGHFAGRAVEAHDILSKDGIEAQVLHCATPLGMNTEELFGLIGDKPVVTCEDHHADTGIGSIAAMLSARAGRANKFVNMGVTAYGCSGPSKEVLADMGLAPEDIARKVKELLNR